MNEDNLNHLFDIKGPKPLGTPENIEEHRKILEQIFKDNPPNFSACLHESCPECKGSGVKFNGQMCVHMISCPCPKCSIFC